MTFMFGNLNIPHPPSPSSPPLQYATCDLIHSPEVAAGQPPAYGNSGVDSVPMVSGYKPGSSSTASAGRR